MARLSRGLVMVMVIVGAIQLCSHQKAEAVPITASARVSWGEPCSAEAKAKIEGCMKEADTEKCCPILHSIIDNSCPCWSHARITNRQLSKFYFINCNILHPLCSTAHQVCCLLIH